MKTILGFAILWASSIAFAAQSPTYLVGKYTSKLSMLKRAASLALKNPDCKAVSVGMYIQPSQQVHPGKAYLVECDAPGYPGDVMDLYFSENEVQQGTIAKPIQPVSIAAAKAYCKNALKHAYSPDAVVTGVSVSDNKTANRRVNVIVSFQGYTGYAYCLVTPSGRTTAYLLPQ